MTRHEASAYFSPDIKPGAKHSKIGALLSTAIDDDESREVIRHLTEALVLSPNKYKGRLPNHVRGNLQKAVARGNHLALEVMLSIILDNNYEIVQSNSHLWKLWVSDSIDKSPMDIPSVLVSFGIIPDWRGLAKNVSKHPFSDSKDHPLAKERLLLIIEKSVELGLDVPLSAINEVICYHSGKNSDVMMEIRSCTEKAIFDRHAQIATSSERVRRI